MAFLHEEEGDHNATDKRKKYGAEDRYSLEPQKAHLTGELVIVAKLGDQAGREAGRQTKNLALAIFFLNPYLSFKFIIVALFYALYLGLVTSNQFNKVTFRHVICVQAPFFVRLFRCAHRF